MKRAAGWMCLLALLLVALGARAEPASKSAGTVRFAVILGVNHGVDADMALLRYADDDAAKYQELFRGLGARTYLLSRLDENTARLHPQAAAEARTPNRAELLRALAQVEADVKQALSRNLRAVVYFVYSGHGNVETDEAYLSLEDARLFGRDLDSLVLDRLKATEYHVIVDACYSSLLASARGPGGKRREARGFSSVGIKPRDNVGLLFSTGSAKESHEWAGVESGVFSHEVRSGLYGAADADADGLVTYPEMVAFIQRANVAIPAERFRPDVFARAPRSSDKLVDLRRLRLIRIDRAEHAHYQLEDSRGVQIAEFHNSERQGVSLVWPGEAGPLYLRRVEDDVEFAIPPSGDSVRLADLEAESLNVAQRGAATHAYSNLFSQSFGPEWVQPLPPEAVDALPADRGFWTPRRGAATGLFALGAAGLAGGVAATLSASHIRELSASASQLEVADANRRLSTRSWEAVAGFGLGALAVAGGVTVLAWPERSVKSELAIGPSGAVLRGSF